MTPPPEAGELQSFPQVLHDTPQLVPKASSLATTKHGVATSERPTTISQQREAVSKGGREGAVASAVSSGYKDDMAGTPVDPGCDERAVCMEISDSAFVDEITDDEDSGVLIASMDQRLSLDGSQDVEAGLLACQIMLDPPVEDPPIEEESEDLDCVNVDDFIARELEDLMSELCRPSLVEYREPTGLTQQSSALQGFVPLEELLDAREEESLMAHHRSM